MAVCFAYFDASGSGDEPNKPILTVAGYIASESKWNRFTPKWNAVLAREGLTHFHMKDFAHFKKEFAVGWRNNEPRRQKLLIDLTHVAKITVRRAFSRSIHLSDYRQIDKEYQFHERAARPYGVCAGAMLRTVLKWMRVKHPQDDVLFAFEKGDTDQSEIERLIKLDHIKLAAPVQILEKSWKNSKGEIQYRRPFEACDLIAYEHSLAIPLIATGRQARGSFRTLAKQIPHAFGGGALKLEHLLQICNALKIPRR